MIPISKPFIGSEEKAAVQQVLDTGMLASGAKVKELEEQFRSICNTKYAIATSNGTSAIHTALYAIGVKPGNEVITTPFTFVASANPIIMQGAKVVFSDIEENTFNLDPSKIEEKITDKTTCILPVDLYGHPFDQKLSSIAKNNGLVVIEDACQAIGASRNGRQCGSLGNAGAFSLYATKNIMCGEGGMITTDSEELAEKARQFRHHGQSEKTRYEYADIGYNYRLTDIQAAIAVEQMKRLETFTNQRIETAKKLSEGLQKIPGITIPSVSKGCKHVFHQYTIRITEKAKLSRDAFAQKMKDAGIGTGIYYPKPLHMHPHFARKGYNKGDFPVSELAASQVVSLPVHPQLRDKEIEFIIAKAAELLT